MRTIWLDRIMRKSNCTQMMALACGEKCAVSQKRENGIVLKWWPWRVVKKMCAVQWRPVSYISYKHRLTHCARCACHCVKGSAHPGVRSNGLGHHMMPTARRGLISTELNCNWICGSQPKESYSVPSVKSINSHLMHAFIVLLRQKLVLRTRFFVAIKLHECITKRLLI